MSFQTFMFKHMAARGDKKRDAKLVIPDNIVVERDINYLGNGDKMNLMDINYEKGTTGVKPTIVSIHGGGYIYGTKEVYKHYAAYLASLGFVVVNFNYHLAPKAKFPSQLSEINSVMEWIAANGREHHIDLANIIMVGDSAGAQLCSHYAAIFTNPEFEKLFPFETPKALSIKAIGLNCGMYKFALDAGGKGNEKFTQDLYKMYVGREGEEVEAQLDVLGHITENYPATYVMTSYYDFLRANAEPMYDFLKSKGIECMWKCYGTEAQKYMGHVCHVNMNLAEAKKINQDEAEFFRRFV
ncbi:MAG: alpha/beta hydrolase [Pseudobutyrivibrio sp.]|nr:alpha/beta hydrolase [Pseudobutyrivibrio sp.]